MGEILNEKHAEAIVEAIDALRFDMRAILSMSDRTIAGTHRSDAREACNIADQHMKRARELLKEGNPE